MPATPSPLSATDSSPAPPLSAARQRELVSIIAELGPRFAERAVTYDREASFPYENFEDLAAAGFLHLCIPTRYGGLGADFATYARVAEEIGKHCGSTALTFNMHSATCLLTGPIADLLPLADADRTDLEARRVPMFADIVANGTIHAQPFSEGLSVGATSGIATTATPVDGGFIIKGRKIFASLSDAADMHNITCLVPGDDRVRLMGVPATAEGVEVVGDWDPLGMRGTISKNLEFHDVFIPAENEWLPPGLFDHMAAGFPFFYMTLSFAYVGLMRGVIDFTGRYLRGEFGGDSRTALPQKQAMWAQMNLKHQQAQALMYHVVDHAVANPDPAAVQQAWASMVTTMESAPDVASMALRTCGGRSLLKTLPLERMYRDARCGATMLPWSVEVCLDRLGRFGLVEDAPEGEGRFV